MSIDSNFGIGLNNSLVYKSSVDLKRFKEITTGKNVVMGRKTWESLPKKPLPDRSNFVITSEPSLLSTAACIPLTLDSFTEKIKDPEFDCFLIGGATLVEQLMAKIDKFYITLFGASRPCDTFCPILQNLFNKSLYKVDHWSVYDSDLPHSFVIFSKQP
jgi:dihydrofolate reductase